MIITHTDYEGLAAIVMEDECLRAVVIPGWGGKIASLYDLRHDREWLHRNPHLPYRLPTYGDDYVRDFDAGGFRPRPAARAAAVLAWSSLVLASVLVPSFLASP